MWMRLVFKELYRRKWGFLLSSLAVGIAIGAGVLVKTMTLSLEDNVRVISLSMGRNIMIVPEQVSQDRYYRGDFGEYTMPETVLEQLTRTSQVALVDNVPDPDDPGGRRLRQRIRLVSPQQADQIVAAEGERRVRRYAITELADHFSAELQASVSASAGGRQMQVVLTGQRKEEGRKKAHPMSVPPEPGQAALGSAVAGELGVGEGATIEVAGRPFRVQRVEPAQGTIDDVRVFVSLSDAQGLLGKPGRVNRVMALGCLCEALTVGQMADVLQMHLNQWADSAGAARMQVVPMMRIAVARDNLRNLIGGLGRIFTPVLALVCAALIGGYFYFNIRERQQEIGVLLALGYRPLPILSAVVLKLALVSLLGGLLGVGGGIVTANLIAPAIQLRQVIVPWQIWPAALVGALLLTGLAGVAPLIVAGRTEAASILRNS